jgi:hypothetical protein
MKIGLILISFFLIFKAGKKPEPRQAFDKSGYYRVMASGGLAAIDSELVILDHAMPKEKEAYEGALQMRKAGFLRRPKEKLAVFRSGAMKLETALARDSANGEYHFLRLVIQEHAPAVVHYNKDKEKDSQYIYRNFKNLSPAVQQAIIDYSRHSRVIRTERIVRKDNH